MPYDGIYKSLYSHVNIAGVLLVNSSSQTSCFTCAMLLKPFRFLILFIFGFFLKVDFHPRRRCRTVSAVLTRNDESEDSDLCSEISNIEDRDWEPDEEKQDDYISDSDDSPEVCIETSVMSSVIDYVDLQESKVKKGVVLQASKIVREKTRNNKLNCCLFCGKYNTRISRRYTECHYRESEVARILSFPKRSLQRKQLWTKLVNRGNYEHNYEVIKEGSGMIVPKYRPREDEQKEAKLYIPCQFCFGTYKKEDLWKH